MLKVLNEQIDQQINWQMAAEKKQNMRQEIIKARITKNKKVQAKLANAANYEPEKVGMQKYNVLCQQVENANKITDSLEKEAIDIQARLKYLNDQPNIIEGLTSQIKDLEKDIHDAEFDQQKLVITQKQFQRIKFSKTNDQQEKKIQDVEKQLAMTYDAIFELE